MANKIFTVFQNLDKAVSGNWTDTSSTLSHSNSYDLSSYGSGGDVIYKAKDKEDYVKTKLELQQNAFLQNRWRKANVDLSVQAFNGLNNIKLMYRDADLMDAFPEIGAALDIISEEACVSKGSNNNVINVYSKSDRVKNILEDLFVNRLDIQTTAVMIIRAMCKYGNQFMLLNIDNKNGVMGWRQLPVFNVERLENGIENPYAARGVIQGKVDKNDDLSTKFIWVDENNYQIPFRNWQIGHFRLINNSMYLPYGVSVLNSARRHWRMLSLMEDLMLIYRLERSIERRVYKIFVGAIDDADVPAYIEEIANSFKRTPIIDPLTGQLDLRKNIMPVRKDTPIPLLDGRTITIEELSKEYNEGKENYVYSIQDKTLQIVPGKVVWCGKNYTAEKVVKITLDDGTYTVMAPEHEVIMRDGSKKRADELKENESIMPFYRKKDRYNEKVKGEYEWIYNPHNGLYEMTHRLVGKELPKEDGQTVIHHCNISNVNNKFDNSPKNLKWMSWADHHRLHRKFNSANQRLKAKESMIESWIGEGRDNRIKKMNIHFDDFIWSEIENNIVNEKIYNRETLLNFINTNLIDYIIKINCNRRLNHLIKVSKTVVEKRIKEKGFENISLYLEHVAEKNNSKSPLKIFKENISKYAKEKCFKNHFNDYREDIRLTFDDNILNGLRTAILNGEVKSFGDIISFLNANYIDYMISKTNVINNNFKFNKTNVSRLFNRTEYKTSTNFINSIKQNHKVKSIEFIEGDDVYCMTVVGLNGEEDRHNFAIRSFNEDGSWNESGIFVSNCIDNDIYIPTRTENCPTPIDTLQAGQNLTAMDDIKFVQHKVLTALRIPKTFLNFEENAGDGKNLALMDIRFTRTINRIQQAFLMELTKIASIHLYLLGFDDELTNFSLSMNNPSTQAEQLEIENIQKKISAVRDAVADPGNGIPIMSLSRALREIMKWSDKEIQENFEELRLEKALAAELEKTTQIIKKTGIFDKVDRVYGEPGAQYQEEQANPDDMGDGGPMGGGGGGMPPMDSGDGIDGEIDGLGDPGADANGEISGNESEIPITDDGTNEMILNKKPMLTENIIKNTKSKGEYEVKRADIFDKTLMINEEFNSILKALDELK